MKIYLFIIYLICFSFTSIANAESLYEIRAKQFFEQLEAYNKNHSDNLKIIEQYSEGNRTQGKEALYFLTICNTVKNLKRAETLILDNPEYAQYLNGNILPSIQENLDFHQYAASLLDGTDAECK